MGHNIALIAPKVGFSSDIHELNHFWNELAVKKPYQNIWSGVGNGLLTIASLFPQSCNITFIDENNEEIDYNEDFDLIAISAMTQQINRGLEIAKKFKSKNKKVIIGGIHPTLLPNEVKEFVDSVVIGEAEYILKEIYNDFKNNSLKKFYKSNSLVDLSDSPIPKFELLNPCNYEFIWLQTSRGCPHKCDYCSSSRVFGDGYRRKSNKQILEEIKYVNSLFPDKSISFSDDNFFINLQETDELLSEIERMGIKWQAQTDIAIGARLDNLYRIKQSGCIMLFIGFESVKEEQLKEFDVSGWKLKKLKHYSEYINNIQNIGIGIMGSFIVGFDSDNKDIFDEIELFINQHNLYHASITILTPFAGTKLRERLEKSRRISVTNWEKYTGYNVTFRPLNMSKEDIESGITLLYKNLYNEERFNRKMEYFKNIQKELIKKGII